MKTLVELLCFVFAALSAGESLLAVINDGEALRPYWYGPFDWRPPAIMAVFFLSFGLCVCFSP